MPDPTIPRPVLKSMERFESTVGEFFRAKHQGADTEQLASLDLKVQRDLDNMNAAITREAWKR